MGAEVKSCQNGTDPSGPDGGVSGRTADGLLPGPDHRDGDGDGGTRPAAGGGRGYAGGPEYRRSGGTCHFAGDRRGAGKRIVAYRTEHGPFEGPEGLMEVSGIGEKKLEELRDYITVSNGT